MTGAMFQTPLEKQLAVELERTQRALDFYRRRCDELQRVQSTMRDPERTIVCDILANGHVLPPEVAGDRYSCKGGCADTCDVSLNKIEVPAGLSKTDASYWLENRSSIIEAISQAGFRIMSRASKFWLQKVGDKSKSSGHEISLYERLVELQNREIAAARNAGLEFFLEIPDAWYEPRPTYGCENGHISHRYLKSEEEGKLCLACQKPIVMLPGHYTEESLSQALRSTAEKAG